jgi:hypothetical protein
MPELAENAFPDHNYSLQREKEVVRHRNKTVRYLTDVGSFSANVGQVPEVRGRKRTASFVDFVSATDACWVEVETSLTGYHARQSAEIVSGVGTSMGVSSVAGVGEAVLGNVTVVAKGAVATIGVLFPNVLASALSSTAQTETVKLKSTTVEIVEEAERRIRGHENLIAQLHSIVEEEADRLDVIINRIIVRPGWSHEYEDKNSVVMYIDIRGETETRFCLWDSTCEKIDSLGNSLPPNTAQFLRDNIFVVVNQD